MTPKEKAEEIVGFYQELAKNEIFASWNYYHKKCAKEAVMQIIFALPCEPSSGYYETTADKIDDATSYWFQVIKEIENIPS